jgi:hypothetical protein
VEVNLRGAQMWVQILFLNLFCSILIFSKFFSKFCFKTLYRIFIFQIFPPKLSFLFSIFLQIWSYEFLILQKNLDRSFVFEFICTCKLVWIIFMYIYFAYNFLFEQVI